MCPPLVWARRPSILVLIANCNERWKLEMGRKPRRTRTLVNTPLFRFDPRSIEPLLAAQISYQRAKEIGLAYGKWWYESRIHPALWKITEIHHCRPVCNRYNEYNRQVLKSAYRSHLRQATTLLTIQYNLAAGTLARYLTERNDLHELLQDILRWRTKRVHQEFVLRAF